MSQARCTHCDAAARGACGCCTTIFYCSDECRQLDFHFDRHGDHARGHRHFCAGVNGATLLGADMLYGAKRGPALPDVKDVVVNYRTLFRALARVLDLYHGEVSRAVVRALDRFTGDERGNISIEKLRAEDKVLRGATEALSGKALEYMSAFRKVFLVDNKAAITIMNFLKILASINPDTAAIAAVWGATAVKGDDLLTKTIPTLLLMSLGVQLFSAAKKFFAPPSTQPREASMRSFFASETKLSADDLFKRVPAGDVALALATMARFDTIDDLFGSLFAYAFSDTLLDTIQTAVQARTDLGVGFSSFLPLLSNLTEFLTYQLGSDSTSVGSYAMFKTFGLERATDILTRPVSGDARTKKLADEERSYVTGVLEIFLSYIETVGPNIASQFLFALFSAMADSERVHWFAKEFERGIFNETASSSTANIQFVAMFGRFVLANCGPLFGKIQQITFPLLEMPLGKDVIELLKDDGKIAYPRMGPAEVYAVLDETQMNAALGDYVLDPVYHEPGADGREVNPGRGLVASIGQVLFARGVDGGNKEGRELVIKVIKPRGFVMLAAEQRFVNNLKELENRTSLPKDIKRIIKVLRTVVVENEYEAIFAEFDFKQEAENTRLFGELYKFEKKFTRWMSFNRSIRIECKTVGVLDKIVNIKTARGLFLPQEKAAGWTLERIISALESQGPAAATALSEARRTENERIFEVVNPDVLKNTVLQFAAKWLDVIYANKEHAYHADLHAGNLFYGKSDTGIVITPIDFGNVRALSDSFVRDTYQLTLKLMDFYFAHQTNNSGDAMAVDSTRELMNVILRIMNVDPSASDREEAVNYIERLTRRPSGGGAKGSEEETEVQLSMVITMIEHFVGLFGGNAATTADLISLVRGFSAILGVLTSVYAACNASNSLSREFMVELFKSGALTRMAGGRKAAFAVMARYVSKTTASYLGKASTSGAPAVTKSELDRMYELDDDDEYWAAPDKQPRQQPATPSPKLKSASFNARGFVEALAGSV